MLIDCDIIVDKYRLFLYNFILAFQRNCFIILIVLCSGVPVNIAVVNDDGDVLDVLSYEF